MTQPFSDSLRREAAPIWERVFQNAFLRELEAGTLPIEKFRYYLIQDYLYLEGFARAVATALAGAPDSTTLRSLSGRILTPIERPLHRRLMEAADLSLETINEAEPSPTNLAYVNHMLRTASHDGLGATAAALLPCPWSYHEIGTRINMPEQPVYRIWASFYIEGGLRDSVNAWRDLLDGQASQAGPRERKAIRRAFLLSSRYEWMFWDMAYRQEGWPV